MNHRGQSKLKSGTHPIAGASARLASSGVKLPVGDA